MLADLAMDTRGELAGDGGTAAVLTCSSADAARAMAWLVSPWARSASSWELVAFSLARRTSSMREVSRLCISFSCAGTEAKT